MAPETIAIALTSWAIQASVTTAAVWATVAGYAITTAALAAASWGFNKIFAGREPSFSIESQARLQTIRSAIEPRRIVYGEAIVGGSLVYGRSSAAEQAADETKYYNLYVAEFAEEGATTVILYADMRPAGGIIQTIAAGSTFSFTGIGDATVYTTVGDATATPDYELNRYRIELTVNPAIDTGNTITGTATDLQLEEVIEAPEAGKEEYTHWVIAHCVGPIDAFLDHFIDGKIPHEIDIVNSIVSLAGPILTSSATGDPCTVTTDGNHGFITGDWVCIEGHTGSDVDINGIWQITRTGMTTFTINADVTVAGAGGTYYRLAQIRTLRPHSYDTEDEIWIGADHVGSVPDLSETAYPVYKIDAFRFAVDVYLTNAGTGGHCYMTRFYDGETPLFRISTHLGATDQAADEYLLAEVPEWNENRRGRGVAYTAYRFKMTFEAYPTGIPNTTVRIRGKADIYDPRNGGSTGYTNNWQLCMRDAYKSPFLYGCDTADLNDTLNIAGANVCDEDIDLFEDYNVGTAYVVDDFCVLGDNVYQCVEACTNHAPPNTVYWSRRYDLSATQKRYTCDGSFTVEGNPDEIIAAMCSAAAARPPIWVQGKYDVYPAYYRTPELTLTSAYLSGPIDIQPRIRRQDLFNAVRGVYSDMQKGGQPTGFPPVTNHYYEVQDGGIENADEITVYDTGTTYAEDDIVVVSGTGRVYVSLQDANTGNDPPDETWWRDGVGKQIFRDIELPFTIDPIAAQRIAKVILERSRQGITVHWPGNLKLLPMKPGETFMITEALLGWSEKIFECTKWSLKPDFNIEIDGQEDAEGVYDWAYGDATVVDLSPDTNLPKPWQVPAPTNLVLTERLYKDGKDFKSRVIATWRGHDDYSIKHYVVEGAIQYSDIWYPIISTKQPYCEINNVPPGNYSVRVKSVNIREISSDWTSADIEVLGLYLVMLDVGLSPPLEPKLFVSRALDGSAINIRFQCKYKNGIKGPPTGIGVSYAVSQFENAVTLGEDNNTELVIDSAEITDQGQVGPMLAGSTRLAIVLGTATQPLPVEAMIGVGGYWCQYGTSEWRKASRYDLTTLYFQEPFDEDPVPGEMLNYRASGWVDNRPSLFRHLYCENDGGDFEVIKWGDIDQSPETIKFTGCTRAQEGTAQIDVTGLKGQFYPSIGPGCNYLVFPMANFFTDEDGVMTAETVLDVNHPTGAWASVTCMAYIETDQGFIRSYIIPCPFAGA